MLLTRYHRCDEIHLSTVQSTPTRRIRALREDISMKTGIKIVFNKLLGGWYVVRGAHQAPLAGRFNTRAEALAYLNRNR